MAFKRKIISKLDCPRCNAVAELRPEEDHREMFPVYIKCPKCKYIHFVGLSSWKILKHKDTIEKLQLLLEKTQNEVVKASIKAKIEKLEEVNKKKELGL